MFTCTSITRFPGDSSKRAFTPLWILINKITPFIQLLFSFENCWVSAAFVMQIYSRGKSIFLEESCLGKPRFPLPNLIANIRFLVCITAIQSYFILIQTFINIFCVSSEILYCIFVKYWYTIYLFRDPYCFSMFNHACKNVQPSLSLILRLGWICWSSPLIGLLSFYWLTASMHWNM